MICSHCLYVDITEPSIIVSVASEGKLRLKMRELSYMQTCNLNFYENLNSAKNYHSFLKLFNIVIIVDHMIAMVVTELTHNCSGGLPM